MPPGAIASTTAGSIWTGASWRSLRFGRGITVAQYLRAPAAARALDRGAALPRALRSPDHADGGGVAVRGRSPRSPPVRDEFVADAVAGHVRAEILRRRRPRAHLGRRAKARRAGRRPDPAARRAAAGPGGVAAARSTGAAAAGASGVAAAPSAGVVPTGTAAGAGGVAAAPSCGAAATGSGDAAAAGSASTLPPVPPALLPPVPAELVPPLPAELPPPVPCGAVSAGSAGVAAAGSAGVAAAGSARVAPAGPRGVAPAGPRGVATARSARRHRVRPTGGQHQGARDGRDSSSRKRALRQIGAPNLSEGILTYE